MKKYGKYEKMPDGTRAKQPPVKSMLLQTYFTSLLCLVLCVTMFFGTSYAWFTSEVKNEGNEIYIGTLDAKLEVLKNDEWFNVEEKPEMKLFDDSISWEPGYTSLETVKISNEGDLSFRYALTFTDGEINGNKDADALKAIAKNFSVYVHAGDFDPENGDPKPNSFADIKDSAAAEDGTWRAVRMGKDPATLADILTREFPVLSGNMEEKTETETYIIALHMLETAGEGATMEDSIKLSKDLMGKRIGLNVKLTCFQRTHEADAFNKDYDLQAHVTPLGALDIYASNAPGGRTYKMLLDTAYQFQPVETEDELSESTFKDYIADFAIWCSDDIPEDSVLLAGYYDLWCSTLNDSPASEKEKIEDRWIAFTNGTKTDFKENPEPIELLGTLVHYKDLCQYGNDGIGFLCGIKNLSEENIGKVVTVELRLYERDENNEKSDHYIVAGRYEYEMKAPTALPEEMPLKDGSN